MHFDSQKAFDTETSLDTCTGTNILKNLFEIQVHEK
jgi:hypothetical protein